MPADLTQRHRLPTTGAEGRAPEGIQGRVWRNAGTVPQRLPGRRVCARRHLTPALLAAALAIECAPAHRMAPQPLLPDSANMVPRRARSVYRDMGLMVDTSRLPFVASVRYLAADLGPEGVRVNAISAGPVRTLSAAGITGFKDMMRHHAERAPLRRSITTGEIGGTAVFLASDLAGAITGEVIHADAGYNIVGA